MKSWPIVAEDPFRAGPFAAQGIVDPCIGRSPSIGENTGFGFRP